MNWELVIFLGVLLPGLAITTMAGKSLTSFGRATMPFLWPILIVFVIWSYTLLGVLRVTARAGKCVKWVLFKENS